ncbi:MAG: CoA transferase [Rhodospirillaceae bacterium]|nr:CoA transferase [Rhodospirillaceae bacterium]|tara:strand:- start:1893 stop:3101 length:1209 start_codon:yes stop_codon:yes gene_type:complete
MNEIPANGPLSGLRILDLSRILAGPICTQLIGDYGADVIKIERPGTGDDTRAWGPPFLSDDIGKISGESAYYLSSNRNKRSLAVDITGTEGQTLIHRLVRHCDVVIQNFKVGGLAKYGLDYDGLSGSNPAIVYCSISGFGQTGPNAYRSGYDLLAQAYGGIMSLTGDRNGEPMKVGVGIADVMCGMYAATAILAALRHRDATGQGQHIDLGLVDAQISWLVNSGTNYLVSGVPQHRMGNQHPNIVPYQVFATQDGHLIVAAGNDAQFERFCDVLGRAELAETPDYKTNQMRLKNRDRLIPILINEVAKWNRDALVAALDAANVPGGAIHNVEDVFASDQVAARDMKITMAHPAAGKQGVDLIGNPVKFSKTKVSYRRPPPMCGEHNDEIMAELAQWEAEEVS